MSKDDVIEAEGKVIEALPNATFKVQLSNGHIITAYISGKLRMNFINSGCDGELGIALESLQGTRDLI